MNVDLTCESRQGFKKGKSTSAPTLSIQIALSKALEQGNFALMAMIASYFDNVSIFMIFLEYVISLILK